MIRNQFFEDKVGGISSVVSRKEFDRTWSMVLAYEERTGISLDDKLTREQYIDLINSMKIRHTSMFGNRKVGLMSYVRYLIANGVLPKEQEEILASITVDDLDLSSKQVVVVHYYKNVAMLREAIVDTVKAAESYDETLYDLHAAILYLAWYGLTEEQIIGYPKSDVLDDGIIVNGEKLEIPFNILQVFKRLRDTDGFYQQAKGVIFHTYVASEYLIRTERNDQIDLNKLRTALYRFNKIADRKYSLRYDVVHQSGIFYRAYLRECESTKFDLSDTAFASEVFCEDLTDQTKVGKARLLARIRDYGLYKQLFS